MVHTTMHLSMGREFAKLKSLRAEFLQDVLSSGTSHKSGNPHTLLTSETNLGVSTTTLRFHNLLEQFTELRKVLHLELCFSYSKGIQIRINQVFPPHRAKSGRVSNMKFPFSQDLLPTPLPASMHSRVHRILLIQEDHSCIVSRVYTGARSPIATWLIISSLSQRLELIECVPKTHPS